MSMISKQVGIDAIQEAECMTVYEDEIIGLVQAEKIIKSLPSAQQWIPVSERLPSKNGRYLVSYEDAVTILDFFNGKWFFPTNGNGCIAHEETDPFIRWMPLPKTYKESE